MKIVLFLGAGFSAAFNLPIMNEFLAFADSSKKLDENDKDFIGRLVLEARRANSFLQSSPTNLEDILSFSVMADRLSLLKNEEESQNYKIRLILQKVFTQVSSIKDFWRNFDSFKSFLSFSPKKEDLSIITTNYDICTECALIRLGLSTNPGFSFVQEKSNKNLMVHSNLYSNSGIPVYKLHGSVNWYEIEDDANSFNVEGQIVGAVGDFEDRGEKSLPYVCTAGYKSSIAPVIIPPSFLKPDLRGPLGKIWKCAADKLQTANILIFVGYSFPLTDTEMMYFLARSLTDNPGLFQILIIDPFANKIVEKLNSIESKFGSHFKDLLKKENTNWEKTNLKAYL